MLGKHSTTELLSAPVELFLIVRYIEWSESEWSLAINDDIENEKNMKSECWISGFWGYHGYSDMLVKFYHDMTKWLI